ncbi:hypothetical protein F4809DRAFT_424429 [Biscogniauxia mediterranea]|nr:hypothetical protein F4809DRAFT_424429 [Biscogniauxia mediterranea]
MTASNLFTRIMIISTIMVLFVSAVFSRPTNGTRLESPKGYKHPHNCTLHHGHGDRNITRHPGESTDHTKNIMDRPGEMMTDPPKDDPENHRSDSDSDSGTDSDSDSESEPADSEADGSDDSKDNTGNDFGFVGQEKDTQILSQVLALDSPESKSMAPSLNAFTERDLLPVLSVAFVVIMHSA